MSAATETILCNYAIAKIGGGLDAGFKITSISGSGDTEVLCETLYDPTRKEVLCRADWAEATKYADLGDDLKDTQIDISSIAVGADPFPVTVTTDSVHGLTTGDTIYLLDIAGTGGIEILNGLKKTITVVDTTSFTLDSTAGTANWSHTADTGVMSDAPESGNWEYVFAMPSDYLGRAKQIDESYHRSTKARYNFEYDKKIVQGFLFTNLYSNADGDSAYIKYIYDLEDPSEFSPLLYEAVAVKLAAELCPCILADKGSMRRYYLLQEYERLTLPLAEGANAEQSGDNEDEGEFTALTCRVP